MTRPSIYEFHKANIHERRFAAWFVRSLPLAIFTAVCFSLIYGVFADETLLLAVCAILNLLMWLFIVSTCLYCIAGAYKVMSQVNAQTTQLVDSEKVESSTLGDDSDRVVHLIVLPNYKEDESILAETLTCLAEAVDSTTFHVVLAMETRENGAGDKARRLQYTFKDNFASISASFHPTDLVQTHLDDSVEHEVPGKASNLKWAVEQAIDRMRGPGSLNIGHVLLTVADADCLFHPCYFSTISRDFNMLREGPGAKQQWCMWQAPQLSYRSHWPAPLPSRVWTYVSSIYEFGGTSSLHWGGHHMVFSGYTFPLQLAMDVESWDGDVIAEDHHAYLKNFFYSVHKSATESRHKLAGFFDAVGCEPMLQVRPVFLPVKSTPVIGDSYWQSWTDRWHQATRHCQGVAELPYALLACWDMIWSLDARDWSFQLIYKTFRVLTRLFCMHILPLCQATAFLVISLYFGWHKYVLHTEIKHCPSTLSIFGTNRTEYFICGLAGAIWVVWPLIVPFCLVILSNYLFLLTGFLQPAQAKCADKFAWYEDDGSIQEPPAWWACCTSKRLVGFILIAVDIVVFLPIVIIPYGFIAAFFAYWHVLVYGNRFEYITAAKVVKSPSTKQSEYGTMNVAP